MTTYSLDVHVRLIEFIIWQRKWRYNIIMLQKC